MNIKTLFFSVLLGVGLASSSVLAQSDVPDLNLSDFDLGEIVAGDEVDLTKLEGRVVVVEYWGPR